jgi:oxygen-independent coproporphyrinogen-3 oxidase
VERELRAVGRPHRAETVAADVGTLRAAGVANISFDLIAGLPYQTAESWETSLAWLAWLRPEHASVYMLEIDHDSRLGAETLASGSRYSVPALPGEDAVAEFYCRAVERLAELGYRQYEISNVALPGRESRHNLKYWSGAPYLGFGLDAHSFDGAERWANTDSLDEYLARAARGELPVAERQPADARRRAEERIFLGLRRNDGMELSAADAQRYRPEIDELAAAGLLEFELASDGGRLRLTGRGRLLSNEVFAAFLE